MIKNDSDRDWQAWGKSNPYFGVLADPKFLEANLNDESITEFFATGELHVDHVYTAIRAAIRSNFEPDRILDYGCGVGRLVVPFARRSPNTVGVDVSHAMLNQARINCQKYGVASARLLHVDDFSSLPDASFDLVHSFIVFQHIPVPRGEVILLKLIGLLTEGGVGAIHIVYSDTYSVLRRAVRRLREHVNFVHKLLNVIQGKPFSTPLMQMNSYSLNRIFDMLIESGCSNVHVELTDHGGFHGAMLYFERNSGSGKM